VTLVTAADLVLTTKHRSLLREYHGMVSTQASILRAAGLTRKVSHGEFARNHRKPRPSCGQISAVRGFHHRAVACRGAQVLSMETRPMNTISLTRGLAQTTRRRRWACLALEVMEDRLAPSPSLPLSPPNIANVVADFPHNPGIPANAPAHVSITAHLPHNPD
jgi:hypothetical protein